MSYELFNQATEISRKISRQSWAKALELAMLYGWQPKGTHAPSIYDFHSLNADWHGTYLTNECQMVCAEDALSLAETLEKALDDIPDASRETDWNPQFWIEDELPDWLSPEEKAFIEEGLEDELLDIVGIHPFKFFAGDEKQHLTGFIRFFRLGSFMIL
jgi:hypothetical protein